MYRPVYSSRFKKDVQLAIKRGKRLDKLLAVIETLCEGQPLSVSHRDHPLAGPYAGFRDCHIEPDWILIYRVVDDQLQLILARTGTYSDLF